MLGRGEWCEEIFPLVAKHQAICLAVHGFSGLQGFKELLRLNLLQDEGDATAAFQLKQAGMAAMVHRDQAHKLHREEILAEIGLARKQALLVAKYDKAPWRTSAFGRRLSEAKQRVHELPAHHLLFDLVAHGVISDCEMDPASSLDDVRNKLIEMAQQGGTGTDHRTGRWCDFVDSFGVLRKQRRARLFYMLYALLLEGRNPWHVLATALEKEGTDDDNALLPKCLRVAHLNVYHARSIILRGHCIYMGIMNAYPRLRFWRSQHAWRIAKVPTSASCLSEASRKHRHDDLILSRALGAQFPSTACRCRMTKFRGRR